MSDMVKVTICDGKYTIVQDSTGRTNVLRHGDEWRDVTGDNVILGAAYEIEKLNERIKRLEEAGDGLCEVCQADETKFHLADQIESRVASWHAAKAPTTHP